MVIIHVRGVGVSSSSGLVSVMGPGVVTMVLLLIIRPGTVHSGTSGLVAGPSRHHDGSC